jgi:hypothetical protein
MSDSNRDLSDSPKGSLKLISQLDLTSVKSSSNSSKGSKLSFVSSSKEGSKEGSDEEEDDDEEEEEGNADCELFVEIITEIFEKDEILDASIYGVFSEINDDYDDIYVAVINIGNNTNGIPCAIIEYDSYEKQITIQQISRCSDSEISSTVSRGEQGSGMHIMSKIKEVFFDFKAALDKDVKMIIDSDEANILIPISKKKKINISMGWLFLFSTGQTWYNKLGFREAEYAVHSEIVNEFIRQPIVPIIPAKFVSDLNKYDLAVAADESISHIFSRVLNRIKKLSLESNSSSTFHYKELTFYNALLTHIIDEFDKVAPKTFRSKFKHVPFINDAGRGLRKKKGKKGNLKSKKVIKKGLRKGSRKKT